MKQVVIHTDGGCHGNPGPGAWAAVLRYGEHRRELSGGAPATTNNRMELQGAISALLALKEPCDVEIHTDSQYLRGGITEWIHGWKRNGWKTRERKPVKNADLWQALDRALGQHKVHWRWVKGHAGDLENERCDALAQAEIARMKERLGSAALREHLAAFVRGESVQG